MSENNSIQITGLHRYRNYTNTRLQIKRNYNSFQFLLKVFGIVANIKAPTSIPNQMQIFSNGLDGSWKCFLKVFKLFVYIFKIYETFRILKRSFDSKCHFLMKKFRQFHYRKTK